MAKLGYHDFHYRKLSLGRMGMKAVPESRESFLKRIDQFLGQGNKQVINIESHETFTRVWYRQE